MTSILSSQGMALATAMAVSAGTAIILAFRLQKISAVHHEIPLRSCISSEGRKKKKKKVHFAEDVVDPRGNGKEFRRNLKTKKRFFDSSNPSSISSNSPMNFKKRSAGNRGMMPENRVVLYGGMLRDGMVHHRLAYHSC